MVLHFDFDWPLHASVGHEFDSVDCSITNSLLFISKESGLPVKEETTLESSVPRQFQSFYEYALVQNTGTTVEVVTEASFASQVVVTLLIGISLKSMWNLMNVM